MKGMSSKPRLINHHRAATLEHGIGRDGRANDEAVDALKFLELRKSGGDGLAGWLGVEGTLVVIAPRSSSTRTKSVDVPPVSMPSTTLMPTPPVEAGSG
jgi:hypothetical protein